MQPEHFSIQCDDFLSTQICALCSDETRNNGYKCQRPPFAIRTCQPSESDALLHFLMRICLNERDFDPFDSE